MEGQPRHAAEEEAAEDQTCDPPAPGVCFLPGSGLGLGRAAEAGSGLLPIFRPDGLWINGERCENLLIAISAQARGEGFDAIL